VSPIFPEDFEDDIEDPGLGLDSGMLDVIVLHDGTTMQTHGPAQCALDHCCIHRPSDHPLKTAPLHWIPSINLMMRVCPCGELHPDPDSAAWLRTRFMPMADIWHPCCVRQCCVDLLDQTDMG
jgi:hypothetical protein